MACMKETKLKLKSCHEMMWLRACIAISNTRKISGWISSFKKKTEWPWGWVPNKQWVNTSLCNSVTHPLTRTSSHHSLDLDSFFGNLFLPIFKLKKNILICQNKQFSGIFFINSLMKIVYWKNCWLKNNAENSSLKMTSESEIKLIMMSSQLIVVILLLSGL